MADFDRSMYGFLKESCAAFPDDYKVWEFFGKRVQKREFFRDVERFAAFLQALGVKKGDNVVVCLGNIPAAIVGFYAVSACGAIVNLVHPLVSAEGLIKVDRETAPAAYLLFDEFYPRYRSWIAEASAPVVLCGAADHLPALAKPFYRLVARLKSGRLPVGGGRVFTFRAALKQGGAYAPVESDGASIAAYMHSGGTTGAAKTVAMSNRALNALTDNIAAEQNYTADASDAMLMVLPIFHTFGLGICMHLALCYGVRIILVPKFNPARVCRLVKRCGITYLAGVPNMYAKMLDTGNFRGAKLARIKACYCGGDRVSEELKTRFRAAMRTAGRTLSLSEGYGLTEACVCCINGETYRRENSVGKPVKGMRFAVVDENRRFLPPGARGDLVISGNTLMTCYYGDEAATREATFYDAAGTRWLISGDVGYMDEDGYVYFCDRRKRVVKISGYNVFPQEIENVADELPYIARSCAFAITRGGKPAIKLAVVSDRELDATTTAEIKRKIGDQLLKYSIPAEIVRTDKLPLTQIGKVDYAAAERIFGDGAQNGGNQ